MPPSSTGRWVSRAASTGGGRSYRGQRPVNWYAGLVLIVLVGLFSVIYSRYEYRHHQAAAAVQPVVGHTLFAGLAIDVCGTVEKPLAASTNTTVAGITTPGLNVLNVSPLVKGQAGNNATLGQFFNNYPTTKLTTDSLKVAKGKVYKNGEKCPSGTKDAGKVAVLKYEVWPNAVSTSGTISTGSPIDLKIGSRTLITVGFVPQSVTKLPRPSQNTINAVIELAGTVSGGTTSTSAASTTTTAAGSSTTTTAPSATTTTTAPTGTTTTTK
jgi:hypothetical protein